MVVINDRLQLLLDKKQSLIDAQDNLIKQLQTKHKDFYTWATQNNIDLKNLKIYSAGIAAAMVVALHTHTTNAQEVEQPQPPPELRIIELTELEGLDETAKGNLVWQRYGYTITNISGRYDLDPKLVFATIMVESMGNTYATRQEPAIGDASYGLGQLLYGTAAGLGFDGPADKLFDPEVNIDLICRYHRRNLEVYGDLTPEQLATAYNAGSPYSAPTFGHVSKFQKWYHKGIELGI